MKNTNSTTNQKNLPETEPELMNTPDKHVTDKLIQQKFHRGLFLQRPRCYSAGDQPTTSTEVYDITSLEEANDLTQGKNATTTTPPTYEWQSVPQLRHKRKRTNSNSPHQEEQVIATANRFSALPVDTRDNTEIKKSSKPPPIMLYGIEDVAKLTLLIETGLKHDEYTYKIITKKQLRVSCTSSDSYRTLMKLVRDNNLIGHTFTKKDERPCRIVIKHLHPTTPLEEIKKAIEDTGNTIRGEIINARYGPNKTPLSTFFINLEPHPNNATVKKICYIYNTKVVVEDPIRKKTTPQCKRCQQYGHTRNNCLRPYRCVKCAENHNTLDCQKKDRNTPAKCALCLGSHPANYKGCQVFLEIQKRKTRPFTYKTPIQKTEETRQNIQKPITDNIAEKNMEQVKQSCELRKSVPNNEAITVRNTRYSHPTAELSYAQVVKDSKQDDSLTVSRLEVILIKQAEKLDIVLEQMASLMNLLTTVISKLIK